MGWERNVVRWSRELSIPFNKIYNRFFSKNAMWRDAFGTNVHVPPTNMKWNKGFRIFLLFFYIFYIYDEHRRILIRYLSILQSYHLNFTLSRKIFWACDIFHYISWMFHVLTYYIFFSSPHQNHFHRRRRPFKRRDRKKEKRARNLNRIDENFSAYIQ